MLKLRCNLIVLIVFFAFQSRAQSNELFDTEWMLYPNYDLPDSLEPGDSLFFIFDTITQFNPEVSVYIEPNGRFTSSLTSFSYPTQKGIITSKEDLPTTYTAHRDTISTGDTLTVVEYTTENELHYNHGPAACSVCFMDLSTDNFEFTCGILVDFGENGILGGPFDYEIKENRLILIKK